jgi:hypothetical protein
LNDFFQPEGDNASNLAAKRGNGSGSCQGCSPFRWLLFQPFVETVAGKYQGNASMVQLIVGIEAGTCDLEYATVT